MICSKAARHFRFHPFLQIRLKLLCGPFSPLPSSRLSDQLSWRRPCPRKHSWGGGVRRRHPTMGCQHGTCQPRGFGWFGIWTSPSLARDVRHVGGHGCLLLDWVVWDFHLSRWPNRAGSRGPRRMFACYRLLERSRPLLWIQQPCRWDQEAGGMVWATVAGPKSPATIIGLARGATTVCSADTAASGSSTSFSRPG